MRRKEKAITDRDIIRDILINSKYCTISLVNGDKPYSVVMNFGYDIKENAFYFHCANSGLKLDTIERNNNCFISVVKDLGYQHGSCEHFYQSVNLEGIIEIIDDFEVKLAALNLMIDQLDDNPNTVRKNIPLTDKSISKVKVLKFNILNITAKESIR